LLLSDDGECGGHGGPEVVDGSLCCDVEVGGCLI
jgi:hypothetical protein